MSKSAVLVLLCALALAACQEKKPAEVGGHNAQSPGAVTPDPTAPEVKPPTVEKLVFAFQPQENPEGLAPNAVKLAKYLTQQTGIKCEVFLPTSYAAVVEALRGKNADVAYFSGLPYLVAHSSAGVELLVAEERSGNPFYYSQWYVLADSPIKATADLKGKPIAFTSPTSTSGYLFPLAKMVEDGHLKPGQDPKEFFSDVIFAGGYEQALKALVHGKVEAAAASDYAFAKYLTPDEQAKVRVLVKQGPVPTHGVAIRSELPKEVRDKVKAALLSLNDDANKDLLKSVYGAERFVERSHDDYATSLKKALEDTKLDIPIDKPKQ
jgi:phosphonate transport system substrate-binding protein